MHAVALRGTAERCPDGGGRKKPLFKTSPVSRRAPRLQALVHTRNLPADSRARLKRRLLGKGAQTARLVSFQRRVSCWTLTWA